MRYLLVFIIGLASVFVMAACGKSDEGIDKKLELNVDVPDHVEFLLVASPIDDSGEVSEDDLKDTADILKDRIDYLDVDESYVGIEGDGREKRIIVQLIGVEDEEAVRETLMTTGQLSFRDVDDNELLNASDFVKGGAEADVDSQTGAPVVMLELKDAADLAEVTQQVKDFGEPDNRLVIWVDYEEGDSFAEEVKKDNPTFESAPRVVQVIHSTKVQVTGYTADEAETLVTILNTEELPVELSADGE